MSITLIDCWDTRGTIEKAAGSHYSAGVTISSRFTRSHAQLNRRAGAVNMYMTMSRTRRRNYSPPDIILGPGPAGMGRVWLVEAGKCSRNAVNVP